MACLEPILVFLVSIIGFMNNNQPANTMAGMTMPRPDFRALCSELVEELNELTCHYNVPNKSAMIERALAALAREDCQPIRSKALPAAEGEVEELVAWLRHEAESQHPGSGEALPSDMCDELLNASTRLTRAAELLLQQAPAHVPARLRSCPIHGQQGAEAWGCPVCLREMRNELTAARGALRRIRRWGGIANDSGFDGEVLLSVVAWIDGGAKGPLPPLPAYLGQPLPEGEAQLVHQQAPAPMTTAQVDSEVEELARWVEGRAKNAKIPQYFMKFHKIAAILRHKAPVPAPVRARERPWEREGWLHPQGQWCWHWNRGAAGWDHRTLVDGVEDDTLLLPYWAIPAPGSPDW